MTFFFCVLQRYIFDRYLWFYHKGEQIPENNVRWSLSYCKATGSVATISRTGAGYSSTVFMAVI